MVLELIKKYRIFFLLSIVCLPAIFALLHKGFFISDDGEWMIIRLSAFFETLRSGEIPVRFIARLNNGYGYPLGDFMYPAFLYLGSVIHLVGFGFTNAIKILFGGSMLFSGVFTYLWLQKLFSKYAAFFGAIFYVYMPYHLFDVYQRGSLGEVLALCFVPFIFWQIEREDLTLTSLGIGTLILSHNTLAFVFMTPFYLYLFLRLKEKMVKRVLKASFPLCLGLLSSIFFWLPALYDLQYTVFRSVTISDWNNYFASMQLVGFITILIVCTSVIVLRITKKKDLPQKQLFYLFLVLSLLSIFLSLPISSALWRILPSSYIQFPFRVLSLLIPASAFLFAWQLQSFSPKKQTILGIICSLSVMILSYSYLFPKEYINKGDMYYISNFSTTTIKDEYMPIWVKNPLPEMSPSKVAILTGKGSVSHENIRANKISFEINLTSPATIQINSIYFPGWEVLANNKKQEIFYKNEYGLMQIHLSEGKHLITAGFHETPIRIVTDILSLLTIFVLLAINFTKIRYNTLRLAK